MALKAHLDALTARHHNLEAALMDELKHSAKDDDRISELKRQKLKLKDEMSKLRRRTM
ncbi:MAG: DUF465 domain-containing protein [Pseudomonadota bacterium]